MSVKTYQLYCEPCGYKRITDGTDVHDLREVIMAAIPRGAPVFDPLAKQKNVPSLGQPGLTVGGTVIPEAMKQQKRFKCPKCGRVIMARQIQKTEHIPDETDNDDGRKTGSQGHSLPGELGC